MLGDLQYALRQCRRSPGFTALAVLCLGLGIGVNVAIFGVIASVALRPMPVATPEQLVAISRGESKAWPYPTYLELQARSHVLSSLTASFLMESDLEVDGESEFVTSEAVPANYADVLGVRPSLGRWFTDDAEPAAVISDAVWKRRFRASPDVLGRRIGSASESYTIIGVAPADLTGAFAPLRTDLWVPIRSRPSIAARLIDRERSLRMTMVLGRLRAGATAAEASAELNAIDAQLMREQGPSQDPQAPIIAEHRGVLDPRMARGAQLLTGLLIAIVALILLIACINVGNLLLARGALRQRELDVRRALGATRFRLVRQMLVESFVLATAGGLCGIVFASWTHTLLERTLPSFLGAFALQLELSLDWRSVAVAIAISLLTTILCGLLPAWRTSRARTLITFKSEIGAGPPRRRPVGLVAQVVMSFVLLFVAASMLQAVARLQATDPGFAVDRRLYAFAFIPSPPFTPETRREFYAHALDRVRALPGIRSVAVTSTLPLMPTGSDCASLPAGPEVRTTSSEVDSGYFGTIGIPILAGLDFTSAPLETDIPSVVLNESLARRLWPDGYAVGERVITGCAAAEPATVVGVVGDSAINGLDDRGQAHFYRLIARRYSQGFAAIVVETSMDPGSMTLPVRRTLLGLGQGIRVFAVQPLSTHIEQRYGTSRWLVAVLMIFGLLALFLAAIGLYGVIAHRVALRTQEIGVRMALGATHRDIFSGILGHGLAIVLIGIAIGELLTAALTGAVGSRLEGIRAFSLSTHVAVAVIWIAVALLACYVPAARAARLDPLVALRHE